MCGFLRKSAFWDISVTLVPSSSPWSYACTETHKKPFLGVRKRVISKREVLADVPRMPFPAVLPWQTTAMTFDLPGPQKPERGHIRQNRPKLQNRPFVSSRLSPAIWTKDGNIRTEKNRSNRFTEDTLRWLFGREVIQKHLDRTSCDKLPSARKRLQLKIWRFYFAVAFIMERQINSPHIFFCICFRNDHVDATTAGHTYEKKIRRFSCIVSFAIRMVHALFCEQLDVIPAASHLDVP